MSTAARIILLSALGYLVWRVSQQRGRTLPQKIRQATNELTSGFRFMATDKPQPTQTRGYFNVRALLDLIARAEANRGYDSYYARAPIRPNKPISQMTLAEVLQWQEQNSRARSVSTAVGRYQFIKDTLSMLIAQTGTPTSATFNAQLQDQFALHLLQRRGLDQFQQGLLTAEQFAYRLAQEWAGLPRDASGVSYYHNQAGNRARIAWADLLTVLRG